MFVMIIVVVGMLGFVWVVVVDVFGVLFVCIYVLDLDFMVDFIVDYSDFFVCYFVLEGVI